MSFYPPKVGEKFDCPQHVGTAANANAVGASAAFECGAVLRFTLRIDGKTGEIREAKFKTGGCGYAIAAAEVLAEKVAGKNLHALGGLGRDVLNDDVAAELEVSGGWRRHCLELASDALQTAFADYRQSQIAEWTGEKALICTCFGVSEEEIERIVETERCETVEQVTERCAAGGGCGSCQPLIEDIIEVRRRETTEFFEF